jgi:pullulanase
MDFGNQLFTAFVDKMQSITVLLPYTYHHGNSTTFYLKSENHEQVPLVIEEKIYLFEAVKYICTMDIPFQFGCQAFVIDEYGGKTDLQIGAVIRTVEFDQRFYYPGSDLGVNYSKDKVLLKLWAPTATEVKLKLLTPDEQEFQVLPLCRGDKGVWSIDLHGEFELYCYSYLVYVNAKWKEAVDPYAVAVTVNGTFGVIVSLDNTKITKPTLPPLTSPLDAIIYETHIRDFSIHPKSGISKKGTYLGAAELNTVTIDGSWSGLSYVKDLGVTHIEFLPFHDFAGVDELGDKEEYNWGYNPIHYNVPDGSYCTNPRDPYSRIKELKYLIQVVQQQGIRVIMDVVYNHVFIREESSFEKITPGYYFRHDQYGMPSNGTGVGNDLATERLMVRKFIIDSVLFWLNEYHIDGFRFDLMGIMDIETMNQIREKADEIDSSILIIGEGWDLNTPIPTDQKASIRNQKKLPKIAHFNDWFRDSVKGSTFNLYDRGYALGNEHYMESAKQVLAGSIGIEKEVQGLFHEPDQTVNYVECHDNHTLWDKIVFCCEDVDELIQYKRHRLATRMVLLSQGIPFLHSGQEFFRTKNGIGNSYRSPNEINWLDWERKTLFLEDVNYLKGLIEIRKSHRAFRLPSAQLIRRHLEFLQLSNQMIGYFLKDVEIFGKWSFILVVYNPSQFAGEITLPLDGKWKVLADYKQASRSPFSQTLNKTFIIEPISLAILVK